MSRETRIVLTNPYLQSVCLIAKVPGRFRHSLAHSPVEQFPREFIAVSRKRPEPLDGFSHRSALPTFVAVIFRSSCLSFMLGELLFHLVEAETHCLVWLNSLV